MPPSRKLIEQWQHANDRAFHEVELALRACSPCQSEGAQIHLPPGTATRDRGFHHARTFRVFYYNHTERSWTGPRTRDYSAPPGMEATLRAFCEARSLAT